MVRKAGRKSANAPQRHWLPYKLKPFGDRRTIELKAEHHYLLASDGLWNVVVPQDLVKQWQGINLKQSAKLVLEKLFDLLEVNKSENIRSDNITAVLLQLPSVQNKMSKGQIKRNKIFTLPKLIIALAFAFVFLLVMIGNSKSESTSVVANTQATPEIAEMLETQEKSIINQAQ